MSATTEREARQFWAIHDHYVSRVTGYDCRPNNPDYWWVPELRSSMAVGYHLFDTREAALKAAIAEVDKEVFTLEKHRVRLYDEMLGRR